MIISKRKVELLISYIIVALTLFTWSVYIYSDIDIKSWIVQFTIITILQLIINLVWIQKSGMKIFSLIGFFIIFLYLFSYGQLLLKSFIPNHIFKFDVLDYVTIESYKSGANFCLLIIFFIMIGALIGNSNNIKISQNKVNISKHRYKYCKVIAIILLIISIPFMLKLEVNRLLIGLQNEYRQIFTISKSGFESTLAQMFLPAIILTLIAYKENKIFSRIIFYITITYKIIVMFGGQRGYSIIFIITLVYFYYNYVEKISLTRFLKLIIGAFFILVIINTVKDLRGLSVKSINIIIENFIFNFINNPLLSIFEEFGGTLVTPCVTLDYVPNDLPYLYGKVYYLSIFTIFPNIGGILTGVSESIGWATNITNEFGGGLGGSVIAELYYNFGSFSIVGALVLGILMSKFSKGYYIAIKNDFYFEIAVGSLIFSTSLLWVRGSFELLVRVSIWTTFIIYILYIILRLANKKSINKIN